MKMVTLDLIQKLREKTGLGMMDCKKALVETNGDIEKAIEVLRKKGSLVAEKRSGNKTGQGVVQSYIHAGGKIGVMVEVNCETDFVANTDTFKQFAYDVAMHIAAINPMCVSPEEVPVETLEKERSIYKEQMAQEKKPQNVIDMIVEGKLKKFYSDRCLLHQPFIKNDKLTIGDYMKETIAKLGENIRINRFSRFEIGA
jgi:elongation factor Ts